MRRKKLLLISPLPEEYIHRLAAHFPDLVIADVMMSYVLDGWSVSREMRSDPCLRKIPLMMVSAIVSDKDDSLFPINEQVDAFMSKPIDPAALLRRVAELIKTKQEQ